MADLYHLFECSGDQHRFASKIDRCPETCWRCDPETPMKKIASVERKENEPEREWLFRTLRTKKAE